MSILESVFDHSVNARVLGNPGDLRMCNDHKQQSLYQHQKQKIHYCSEGRTRTCQTVNYFNKCTFSIFICRLGIRACLLLVPLLGLTWLFGLLSQFHKAFAYISTIFNTTQVIVNHSSLFCSSADRSKWLRNLAKFFVVCFCLLFWGLTLQKTWQDTIHKHKTKDMHAGSIAFQHTS